MDFVSFYSQVFSPRNLCALATCLQTTTKIIMGRMEKVKMKSTSALISEFCTPSCRKVFVETCLQIKTYITDACFHENLHKNISFDLNLRFNCKTLVPLAIHEIRRVLWAKLNQGNDIVMTYLWSSSEAQRKSATNIYARFTHVIY